MVHVSDVNVVTCPDVVADVDSVVTHDGRSLAEEASITDLPEVVRPRIRVFRVAVHRCQGCYDAAELSAIKRQVCSYHVLRSITEVLLPRYARLTSEIFATIKTIKKLEVVSIPAKATTANEPADGAADDA